jgi:hypothetical protein
VGAALGAAVGALVGAEVGDEVGSGQIAPVHENPRFMPQPQLAQSIRIAEIEVQKPLSSESSSVLIPNESG